MSNAIVPYDFKSELAMAEALVKSKRFPTELDPYQAYAKIAAGRELGLQAVQSLNNINIIQGRIALGAGAITALIKSSGKYNYRIIEQTNEKCILRALEKFDGKWEEVGDFEFNLEDAKLAGLLGKDNWKKYPSDMLFARCATRMARRTMSDVFGGPVYVAEELEDQPIISVEKPQMTIEQFMELAKTIDPELTDDVIKTALKDNGYKGYTPDKSDEMLTYLRERFAKAEVVEADS